MSLESVNCRQCGSADVTEFKAGTYVCGHCEAVFKHIDQSGTATCACGTFAVGRCAECRIPICSDCSRRVGSVRLCSEHALAAAFEATKPARMAARAAKLQRAAEAPELTGLASRLHGGRTSKPRGDAYRRRGRSDCRRTTS